MINEHLSEPVIQQYALDKSTCDARVRDHMLVCENCKARAQNYEVLFSGLRELSKPAFEFDLPALVLEKLPAPEPTFSWSIFIVPAMLFACVSSAAYIFADYIFQGLSLALLCLIVASTLIILVFQSFDVYKSYQNKINILNSY